MRWITELTARGVAPGRHKLSYSTLNATTEFFAKVGAYTVFVAGSQPMSAVLVPSALPSNNSSLLPSLTYQIAPPPDGNQEVVSLHVLE